MPKMVTEMVTGNRIGIMELLWAYYNTDTAFYGSEVYPQSSEAWLVVSRGSGNLIKPEASWNEFFKKTSFSGTPLAQNKRTQIGCFSLWIITPVNDYSSLAL